MMDFYQAQEQLLQEAPCHLNSEATPLLQAGQRFLAQDLYATQDAPLFDNSAMDGYALCGLNETTWQIIGVAAAGGTEILRLQPGQAARIFTGAGLPENTEAVVAQEDTETTDTKLHVTTHIKAGQHIRRRGEELRKGTRILPSGSLLTPQAIGLAASQGHAQLPCFPLLKVTVFATGDELVGTQTQQNLQHNQIFDSNRPMLQAMLAQQGFIHIIDGGILPDDLAATRAALARAAATSDALVISGGASVGDRDFVKPALSELGDITHWKLAIKPGKPFGWGHIGHCQVMLLPGNPVASFVTMKLLGLPALRVWGGSHRIMAMPECHQAKADFTLQPNHQKRREFLRGLLRFGVDGPTVKPLPQQGSHMLSSCTEANVLIDVPAQTDIIPGQWLTIYPL